MESKLLSEIIEKLIQRKDEQHNVIVRQNFESAIEEIKDIFDSYGSKIWVLHKDPAKLLYDFWQSSSDACPLEVSEAEEQENKFELFVNNLNFTT